MKNLRANRPQKTRNIQPQISYGTIRFSYFGDKTQKYAFTRNSLEKKNIMLEIANGKRKQERSITRWTNETTKTDRTFKKTFKNSNI